MTEQSTPKSYERMYLEQLLSGAEVGPPDPNQCNGFYDKLATLYGQRDVGGPERVAQAALALTPLEATPLYSPEAPSFKRLSWQEVLKLPPTEWLIENEIQAKAINVIVGESNIGKSYLCLDIALHVTHEQDAIVAYVPGEGFNSYRTRLEAWMRHHKKDGNKLEFANCEINLFDHIAVEKFISEYRGENPALVIFDTLSTCAVGADENSSRDMGVVFNNCRLIINKLDTTVLLVHHTNKEGSFYRGSSLIRSNADSMIKINKNKAGGITKNCDKSRNGPEWAPQHLTFKLIELRDGVSDQVIIASEKSPEKEGELTKREYDVLKFIVETQNRSGEPPTRVQIIAALPHITEGPLKDKILKSLREKEFLTYNKNAQKNYPTDKAINFFKKEDSAVMDRHDDVMMTGHNLSSSRHTPLKGYDDDSYDDIYFTDEELEEVTETVPLPVIDEEIEHILSLPEEIWEYTDDYRDDYMDPPEMTKDWEQNKVSI